MTLIFLLYFIDSCLIFLAVMVVIGSQYFYLQVSKLMYYFYLLFLFVINKCCCCCPRQRNRKIWCLPSFPWYSKWQTHSYWDTLYFLRVILTMNNLIFNQHHYLQFHDTAMVLRWLHRLLISSSAFLELTSSLMLSFIPTLGGDISTIFSCSGMKN